MSDEQTPTTSEPVSEAPETPAADPRADRDYINTPRAAEALRALMAQEKSARSAREQAEEQNAAVQQSQALQQLAKADPVAFLERSGIKREDVSKRLASQEDPVAGIRDEMAHLRQELSQQREAADQARMDAALGEAREQVRTYISSAEDAPLTRITGSADQVWQLMTQHHQSTGEVMSEQEAARQVEAHLTGQIDKLLESEATRKLIQDKLQANGGALPARAPAPSATLTNAMQTEENQRLRQDPNMNREASISEAAKLLSWEG